MTEQKVKTSFDGLLMGLGVGLGLSLVLLGLGGFAGRAWVSHTRDAVRAGWTLVPAMTAATDLKEGTELMPPMLSSRLVPEQFVTSSSVVLADVPKVTGLRLTATVKTGQLVRWTDLAPRRTLVTQLFAARDLAAGDRLTDGDLAERQVTSTVVSASWVSEKNAAIGRVTVAPFAKGDPILTTHFAP